MHPDLPRVPRINRADTAPNDEMPALPASSVRWRTRWVWAVAERADRQFKHQNGRCSHVVTGMTTLRGMLCYLGGQHLKQGPPRRWLLADSAKQVFPRGSANRARCAEIAASESGRLITGGGEP